MTNNNEVESQGGVGGGEGGFKSVTTTGQVMKKWVVAGCVLSYRPNQ